MTPFSSGDTVGVSKSACLLLVALVLGACAPTPAQPSPHARTVAATPPAEEPSDQVLRVFVHEGGFPPLDFGETEADQSHGIYPEILNAVCGRLGLSWVPVVLPPGQIYQSFRRGDVDLEIGTSPSWRTSEADVSLYTIAFAVDENVLWGPETPTPVASPPSVGTVIGYVYPSLAKAFANGSLIRSDVPNERLLLQVLHAGRVDEIIITRVVGEYLARELGYRFQTLDHLDRLPLSMRLHTRRAKLLPQLNQALSALMANGTIDRIYRKYR